ncbi:MAG: hypothetical protein ACP5F2_06570 [Athalassotoga sp.]|uniref:hypothetical protein n=1 Tax=Athalassotoga sp. TaxID=2022597 RepID=UPI003D00DA43
MNSDGYKYYSHSPQEWEKIDSQKNPKKPKRPFGRVNLILGINFAAILAIFLIYFGFSGSNTVKVNSLAKVGDFQIYITSPKENYLSGEPLNFYVYLSNLSSSSKTFDIYSFSLKITGNSTPVYVFNTSEVIKSEIGPNSTILLYELKKDTNLSNLKPGEYTAKILMNFDGKIVSIEKTFKYSSVIFASINSPDDFFIEGQRADLNLYVQNNTPNTVNLNIDNISFTIFTSNKKVLNSQNITVNSIFPVQSGQQALIYNYKTIPLNAGNYYLSAVISGSQDLSATSVISVINKSDLSDISGIKIISDIPLYVNRNTPTSFSISLANNDLFSKKYVVLNSLTIIVKKGNIELYRFYNDKSHNIIINPGGVRLLLDSKSWQTITFPSTGTYDFEVIAKIGDQFINYNKKIQSL